VKSTRFVERKRRGVGRRRDNAADELAQGAVVFLVDARTLGRAVRLDVRPNRGGCDIAGRLCIDDADDTRQYSLGQRRCKDPATNKCRNASDH
jgi:hypothetical protein